MPREGELNYYEAIGPASRANAVHKPFSKSSCGVELMQVGALMSLLPPPPARVLECGCGTGWLSYLLQQRGYEVVGSDVSIHALELARAHPPFNRESRPQFVLADTEDLPFESEFDIVVFYDSLHHAVDERKALQCAFRALKPGGVCIASEPGAGHQARSRDVIEEFDVTEKDMPPRTIRKLGKAAGFARCQVYPRADHLGRVLFHDRWPALGRLNALLHIWPIRYLLAFFLMVFAKGNYGITVLHKDAADAAERGSTPRAQAA
jgi:SAM-dependent methyltransferase